MTFLGISAFYHDSAACLVRDGDVVAAVQEERFTRCKHDASFPVNAVRYCLAEGQLNLSDVDYVVFYDKPFIKFERLLETYIGFAPRGYRTFHMAMPLWLREKLFQRRFLGNELKKINGKFDAEDQLLFTEHHLSHAASAFFPSPFQEAVVLTMDGVGEWATTTAANGFGNQLKIFKEIHFPHSLGLLYSAFTYYAGFKVNSGEYKLMGLAPYGRPRFVKKILDNLLDLKEDGSFHLSMSYFNYCTGLTMTSSKFDELFGAPARKSSGILTQHYMDIAASIQAVLDEIVLRITRSLALETGSKNLCLAGGVALNCVTNGKIRRDGRFDKIWVQPAAGDAGGALGAALAAHYLYAGHERHLNGAGIDSMKGSYLGPSYSQKTIEERLLAVGAKFQVYASSDLINKCVKALKDGESLGWFQGRMEFGPRALGARSILGDARSPKMQSVLNRRVKRRESFRPFAPAILREDVDDWFDLDVDSPYMLFVERVKAERCKILSSEEKHLSGIEKLNVLRSEIPAVTHVDYSSRVQTVHRETNSRFHDLLRAFKELTGCPVLVNTSFNRRGEPIVCTPEDAFRCFIETDIEALAIGDCYLRKEAQDIVFHKEHTSSLID